MRFSNLMQCFYPTDIAYPSLPSDIVDVTQADYDLAQSRKSGETLNVVSGKVVIVPAPAPTSAQLIAIYQQSAQTALSATDMTFVRIQEAITLGLVSATDAKVVAWITYRKNLRIEMKASVVGTLPTKPTTYPTGT